MDPNGQPVEQSVYAIYGEQQSFAAGSETKGYIGERHDPETGVRQPIHSQWIV